MAVYGPWLRDVFTAYFTGKTVKALLVTSAFVADPDHEFRSSITNEVAGTGYVSGGVAVTGVVASYDAATNRVKVMCDDVNFGDVDLTNVGGIVFYVSNGSAATDVVIAADTFAMVEVSDATNLTYRPHANGIVGVTSGGT